MTRKAGHRSQVSLADVAAAAGVSKMTASRVLRGAGGISEATRHRVLGEAERLGYVSNKLASTFSSDRSSTLIGVSLPLLSTEAFTQILEGIERTLGKQGFQPILGVPGPTRNAEDDWLEAVLAWRPAGLIMMGRDRSTHARKLLDRSGIPVAEIWDLNTRPADLSIGLDHFDAGYEMGRFLAGSAHRKIGYVGVTAPLAGLGSRRLEGFRQALADAERPPPVEYLVNEPSSFYAGRYGAEHLHAHDPGIDLVYFQDDDMALGGLMWCQSCGLNVPDDIGIAGWGGLPAASILPKKLTTTQVNRLKLGRLAAESILLAIAGAPSPTVQDIGFHLVPGSTVRRRTEPNSVLR